MTIYKSHKILNARNTAARFRKNGLQCNCSQIEEGLCSVC